MSTDPERRIDEMALSLCDAPRIEDETACILMLMQQGFRPNEIVAHIDEARTLANLVIINDRTNR